MQTPCCIEYSHTFAHIDTMMHTGPHTVLMHSICTWGTYVCVSQINTHMLICMSALIPSLHYSIDGVCTHKHVHIVQSYLLSLSSALSVQTHLQVVVGAARLDCSFSVGSGPMSAQSGLDPSLLNRLAVALLLGPVAAGTQGCHEGDSNLHSGPFMAPLTLLAPLSLLPFLETNC